LNPDHILLIEDNPDDEALTLRAFQKNDIGNTIVVTRDGADAIDLLTAIGNDEASPPVLILLDLKLPKVDGLEVLRHIRANERTRLIPVVVLTTSREHEDVLSSYRAGANAYVQKPVKFADFSEVVKTIGTFWLLMVEQPPDVTSASRHVNASAAAP
jgi:CheY-like chemotaxis protein